MKLLLCLFTLAIFPKTQLAMGWTVGGQGFNSWWELGIFLFSTVSRPTLEPTQPPIQWVLGTCSPGLKRPGCEADY